MPHHADAKRKKKKEKEKEKKEKEKKEKEKKEKEKAPVEECKNSNATVPCAGKCNFEIIQEIAIQPEFKKTLLPKLSAQYTRVHMHARTYVRKHAHMYAHMRTRTGMHA